MHRTMLACMAFLLAASVGCGGEKVAPTPDLRAPVMDEAGVLSDAEEKSLTDLLAEQEKQTTNQIVVLTIHSLHGESVESYAEKMFQKWKLGDEKKDNGVLIVAAMDDHKMRIEVGGGLEGILTDVLCSHIIREEMTPKFEKKQYAEGLTQGATKVRDAIGGTYKPEVKEEMSGWKIFWIIVGIVLALILLDCLCTGGEITLGILSALAEGGSSGGSSSGGGGGYGGGGGGSYGGGASGSWK